MDDDALVLCLRMFGHSCAFLSWVCAARTKLFTVHCVSCSWRVFANGSGLSEVWVSYTNINRLPKWKVEKVEGLLNSPPPQ